eukprot:3870942-Amphidinium_carterae.1
MWHLANPPEAPFTSEGLRARINSQPRRATRCCQTRFSVFLTRMTDVPYAALQSMDPAVVSMLSHAHTHNPKMEGGRDCNSSRPRCLGCRVEVASCQVHL